MIRQTSVEALKWFETEGHRNSMRSRVYRVLFQHGPLTANEIGTKIGIKRGDRGNNVHARLVELREMNAVFEASQNRICTVTSRRCIAFDVTNKMPKRPVKPTKTKCKSCNGTGYIIQERLL